MTVVSGMQRLFSALLSLLRGRRSGSELAVRSAHAAPRIAASANPAPDRYTLSSFLTRRLAAAERALAPNRDHRTMAELELCQHLLGQQLAEHDLVAALRTYRTSQDPVIARAANEIWIGWRISGGPPGAAEEVASPGPA